MLQVFVISCLFIVCFGKLNHGIRVLNENLQVGRLDPATGKVACTAQIKLPPTNCSYDLGKGTRGQTSAIFYTNQTVFFLAQEKCAEGNGKTYIMSVMGPFCWDNDKPSFQVHAFNPALKSVTTDLMNLNMAWDHACNIVVLAPDEADSIMNVNQVSEYDGQQRFQPTWDLPHTDCKNCWKKVPGVGALDYGNYQSSWPKYGELYCGDQCTYYTIEEKLIDGVAARERNIVGRYYRNGNVALNQTDSLQVQTLTWYPFGDGAPRQHVTQFVGLGICCAESWCHHACANLDGHLVLILFSPSTGFQVLADVGDHVDQQAIRLGIEWSAAPYSRSKSHQAYVYYDDTVITYDLAVSGGIVKGAHQSHQSPKVNWNTLHLWANSGPA